MHIIMCMICIIICTYLMFGESICDFIEYNYIIYTYMHVCVYIHMRKNEYQIQGGGAKERHGGADAGHLPAARHTPTTQTKAE